ncbi:MAG: hypothetical protein NC348_03060 [Clostridium sp.]|nr:hypothetical protein [Clostridium sp.]
MKPVLLVDNEVVAEGDEYLESTPGTRGSFTINLTSGGRSTSVTNDITTGSMYAVTLDSQSITAEELQSVYDEAAALKDSVTEENVYREAYLGKLLALAGKLYFAQVDIADTVAADMYDVSVTRSLSEGITGYEVRTSSLYGRITSLSEGSLYIDVDTDSHVVVSLEGEADVPRAYMMSAGMSGSLYESTVWEELTGNESVSTVSILQTAAKEDTDILTLSQSNLSTEIEKLNTDETIKQEIINAVNSGKAVIIPAENVTMDEWSGTGYVVMNPETGTGEYKITGGLNGGSSPQAVTTAFLADTLCSVIDLAQAITAISESIQTMACAATMAGGIAGAVTAAVSIACMMMTLNNMMSTFIIMLDYLNGDPDAGGELIDSASWNVVLTVGISVGGLAAKKTLQNILRSELVRTIGTECTERLLKEYGDVKDLSRCVKHILKMDIGAGVIIEMSEKFGKSGLDWILGKKSVGLTDDLVRKILKAESLDNFTDAVVKAIKQSKGYVDDIIEQIIKYGDDAAEAIEKYGDDAADAIKRYDDEAIKGFKTGKTPDEITEPTKPTMKKGGEPQGGAAEGNGAGIASQNNAANILAAEGYDITNLKEVEGGNGYGIKPGKNPDYLINGRVFDCYTPESTTGAKGVIRNIADKTVNQADRIVLNLENYPADSVETLKKRIQDKINGDLKHLKELIVIVNDKVETWFVR